MKSNLIMSSPSRQRLHRTSLGSTASTTNSSSNNDLSSVAAVADNSDYNHSADHTTSRVIAGRKDNITTKRSKRGGGLLMSHHTHHSSSSSYTFGQLVSFAAICSSLAAVLTALIAAGFFFSSSSSSGGDTQHPHNLNPNLIYNNNNNNNNADHLVVTTSKSSRLGGPSNNYNYNYHAAATLSVSNDSDSHHNNRPTKTLLQREHEKAIAGVLPSRLYPTTTTNLSQQQVVVTTTDNDNDKGNPQVAWLISFPNSGTSFTIHMTREASNCTTATNYALEGDIKDKPSVQAVPGPAGKNGPWLELIPDRHTSIPNDLILTKSHCKGFCSGRYCGPEKTIQTVRSFQIGCLSGTRAVMKKKGGKQRLEKVSTTYSPSLVKKAIHIFRHPLDNIVARFHLEYNVEVTIKGNKKYGEAFPKNATGFKRWCALDDTNKGLLKSRFIDRPLRKMLGKVPCFNELYRYVQWHNLAFSMTHDMNIPTMVLHYHEYSTDFEGTRDRVLDFLGLPLVGTGIEFHSGKIYRSYYSQEQKKAIRSLLQELASSETWEQLKDYDYEIDNVAGLSATTK